MTVATRDLWSLVRGRPEVDPTDLAEAVVHEVGQQPLDYRTRLLIRDSLDALRKHWGANEFASWLSGCSAQQTLEAISRENFERPGFPSLKERIVEKTDPEEVRQFLRDLSNHLTRPVRLTVGGSVALILPGHISRKTDDIDVVDEVPAELRTLHTQLAGLRKRYGLELAHFQSHYLPSGWEQRLRSVAPFGQLQVYLVDPHDVFLSKLFSSREKDLDDLRMLATQLDKKTLTRRLCETTAKLRSEEKFRQAAVKNWYILYGEELPS